MLEQRKSVRGKEWERNCYVLTTNCPHAPFTAWGWVEESGVKEWSWAWEREEERCCLSVCLCFSSSESILAHDSKCKQSPCLYLDPWAFSLYFLPLSCCRGEQASGWVGIWPLAKVNSPQHKIGLLPLMRVLPWEVRSEFWSTVWAPALTQHKGLSHVPSTNYNKA